MVRSIRFLLRGKIAAAIESGAMAAALAASVVTADLPPESGASLARPVSSPGCDVICDGWVTSSQP